MLELMRPAPTVAPMAPTDLPLAKVFPNTGWALLHTDLTGKEDVFLAFKSSPYGSISHSHADQNSFVLSRGNRRLLTDSGYYAGYGTPHHLGFYKHSKAHNTILVDGRGQMINESKAAGRITRFAHTGEIDYVCGDAQAAYGLLLRRFDRHVVFLRPNVFIILDDIEAEEPARIDWLLHAPVPFETLGGGMALRVRNGSAFAHVHVCGAEEMICEQNARFDPPPQRDEHRPPQEVYRQEFHWSARTAEARRDRKSVV